MRILLVATSLRAAYGGPAFSVPQLATALGDHDVEVGLWAADGSAADAELFAPSAKVKRLSGSLGEEATVFGPHLIHDNGVWLPHNHRTAELASARGIARIVSTRGMLEPWAIRHKGVKKTLAWELYQRRDLQRASALHATAEAEAANLEALGLDAPIITIPNGVDLPSLTETTARPAAEARTALFLGRLYPIKGLPMLIEAWATVRPAGWRLVIAGPDEGGHRAVLEQAVAAGALGDVVSFAGPVAGGAKSALLRQADLFILPSHSESFGMALAEALAHATPVLTTTAVPWPMLEARGCGWRTAPTVEALAAALQVALGCDRPTLARMGVRGRALVAETLGWDGIAAQFTQLYERQIQAREAAA